VTNSAPKKEAVNPSAGNEPTAAPVQTPGLTIDQALAAAYGHWNAGQVNQAEILCQKVLATWPENGEALHLLGLMALNWGNLDLAIDYLRRACRTPRAPATYFSNLAEMCRRKGLLEEGETAARRAVALDPTMVGAWNNLGILLQEEGKFEESLSCLERVITYKPDYAEAHNNLGNTLKKLGQLDRARQYYMKALELIPNYPEGHSNLSNLLKELGDIEQAVTEAKKAIEINPRFAEAYINASAAESARNNHEEALRWLNAMLSFAPNNALGLSAKSGALHKLERFDEALEVARQAIMAMPESGDAYNALGQAQQALGFYDKALESFEKAASLVSTIPEQGLSNKALLLMEINKPDDARAAFAAAAKINPRSASVLFNASDLKTYRRDDHEIDHMENLLSSNQVQSFADKMALHFALGKAWLDVGNADRAFEYFNKGNGMKRSTITYDAEATTRWLEFIAQSFPPSLFERMKEAGFRSKRPIFIIGMPRSGTTLVEQILAAHPDVLGAGELSTLRQLLMPMKPPEGRLLNYPDSVHELSPNDIAYFGKTYIAETDKYARNNNRVVDKMPANFLYAGMIALCLPEARIIHCRRDPVDTCLSCYTKLFSAEQHFSYDLAELGHFYNAYAGLMQHWRKVFSSERFIEVDYESVVENLEIEAKRMVAFCNLPWDEACMKFHQSSRPIRTASVNQVRQPIYSRSVGRWKKYSQHLSPLLDALKITVPTGQV